MNTKRLSLTCLATIACASLTVNASWQGAPSSQPTAELLAMGLQGASGSTVGPDGALYVTEGALGRVSRVDPETGAITTFASGLPPAIAPIGGAIDVAFIGRTAYVLVTLIGNDVGGNPLDVVGIYRVNGPRQSKVVADLGTFSRLNPPERDFPIDVPSGLQYALEVYRGAFLVTDGHLNRVLRATVHGEVSEVIAFDNIVPTGLEVSGPLVFMAQAGPVPHLPEDGKVVVFLPQWPFALEVASGGRLLVDVEFGRNRTLYALSQGEFPVGGDPAAPALPNTGALLKANWDGTLTVVTPGLNQPTSLEFIRDTAYVVTLGGEIWKIDLGGYERWGADDDDGWRR
jgi:hypothetical protein